MSNCKPCFLAGVCCIFYSIVFAQPDWPERALIKDTSISNHLPAEELNNTPPRIIYRNKPAELLFIDGDPSIIVDEELRMYRIVNTDNLIIKNHHDNKYYLYDNIHWYVSDSATYNYVLLKNFPDVIRLIDGLVKEAEKKTRKGKAPTGTPTAAARTRKKTIPEIVVSTEPAELIQTNGEPRYIKIPGTSLVYVSNTRDNLFRDTTNQQFYLLLSGRWYQSPVLDSLWVYTPPDQLPQGFYHIPADNPKAYVLAHVPGTDSARKALEKAVSLEATKIRRDTATLNIIYDGGAEFSSLSNTGMFVSENSNIPVINIRDKYYALQNGIWYKSNDAIGGIWEVSPERPPDIDKIPSTHRMYFTRFVYIYDTTSEYVYTGYTSGYKNAFIENNTVVWGTGWPYKSWNRRLYYSRQPTWGSGYQYQGNAGWIKGDGLAEYKSGASPDM